MSDIAAECRRVAGLFPKHMAGEALLRAAAEIDCLQGAAESARLQAKEAVAKLDTAFIKLGYAESHPARMAIRGALRELK